MTHSANPSSKPPRLPRILVIEDEPQMLRNLQTILKAEGFDAVGATGGLEGIARSADLKPDLILCDLMMPDLDGFGVLARVRANPVTASIPFIFLTARGDRNDMRSGMNLGADDYLTKPVRADDLLSAVRARLARFRLSASAATARIPENASQLEALGVSPREAEVLYWLIEGKSNADIGTILGVAEATVKKHLERVFLKLGVENRTAAIRAALDRIAASPH
ncbi:MAG: response regulator transcription factor [Verrucomicrobiales bacterium]|nr:response regulator transcription factor [Verrucomicrobiales bacterium]